MKNNTLTLIMLASIMAVSSTAFAGKKHHDKSHQPRHKQFVYAKVVNVKPIYREIRVSTPVKQCWSEPVNNSKQDRYVNNPVGATIAGGLMGGVIGHQFGKGRGNRFATVAGTVIGATLGHDSSRGYYKKASFDRHTSYENHCKTTSRISYEQVVDSYSVSYRYKGKRYQTNMPYDPGKKIKLKITIVPVV